jgi:signal transduction histidine kinase/CheY-like chemotaxis protein
MDPFDPAALGRCVAFTRGVALVTIAVAALALVGWAVDLDALTHGLSGTGVMKPLSAVAFLCTGVALLLRQGSTEDQTGIRRGIAHALASTAVLIGVVTLIEYGWPADFGVDALLFRDSVIATNLPHPGRMTPAAAIGFTGLGAAILLLDRRVGRLWPAQIATIVPGIAGLVGFLGYLYGPQSLLNVTAFSSMAIHTSALFLAMSSATLFARPRVGFPRPIMSRFTGGLLARRILPLAIVLPFFFGWLRLWGERAGLYDTAFGVSIFASSNITIFVLLVWIAATRLNRTDSARHAATERLRANEARSRALYEHAVDLILTIDAEGLIRFVNPSAQWRLRIPADAAGTPLEPVRLESLIETHDRERLRRAIEHTIAAKDDAALPIDFRVPREGAEPLLFDALARNLLRNGDVAAILINARDVTSQRREEADRRKVEARFLNQLRESQKMQALGTLAGGIAHDFNNILAAISGNLQLAREDVGCNEPVQRNLAEIRRATDRATDLVRRILAFARRQEPVTRVIDLRDIVTEAIELLRATLPSRIELVSAIAPDLPKATADATQLLQVVMNLGTNAAHAIGTASGQIEITLAGVSVDAEFAKSVPELSEGHYVRLSVWDSGCGIEPATLPHIFEPFFTTKPLGQGTGLGLSVVDGIVRNHFGAVSVYSEVGKGTVLHVYLPAITESVIIAPPAALEPPRGNNQHIMYVDDEEALAWLAHRFLERLGYRVSSFTDPRQALEIFANAPHDFAAVVTDLAMPGLSGPQLAERMLAIRADIPVILTSGYVTSDDVAEARRIGVRDVLLKPNSIEELAMTLHRTLHVELASTS